MKRFLKSAVLALAVGATTLSAMAPAEARDGWRHHHRGHGGGRNGDLVAAGVLGLAVGAIAAGIATNNNNNNVYYEDEYYRDPPPRPRPVRNYYVQREPEVVYLDGGLEPWTREWYSYCDNRYRSFDPGSGTFVGYDGETHFCTAN